jgi:hypothetical protein
MPELAELTIDRQAIADENVYASATNLYTKIGDEFFYPGDINPYDYYLMKERDGSVGIALDVFIGAAINMIGEYQHEDPVIKNLVQRKFNLKNKGLRNAIKAVLSDSLTYGYGVSEEVWKVEDREVGVKLVHIEPQERYVRFLAKDDEELTHIKFISTRGQKIEIPIEKCFVLVNGTGIYGKSKFRRIYREWKFKKEAYKWFARGSERTSSPLLVGKVSNISGFMDTFEGGWNVGVAGIRKDEDIKMLSPGSDMSDSFIKIMNFLNKTIYLTLAIPQLILEASTTGAYALSETHMDMFKDNARDLATGLAEDIIQQIVSRILLYQFGIVDDNGSFDVRPTPTPEDLQKFSNIFKTLIDAAILDPQEEFIRDTMRLPKKEEDFLNEPTPKRAKEGEDDVK